MESEMGNLNRAISVYVGWKISPFPKLDETRVLDFFGPAAGTVLLSRLNPLVRELEAIRPNWEEHDLVSASKWAVGVLVSRHPHLADEGKAALEWLYSWWWK
jgi:hypothetical protein